MSPQARKADYEFVDGYLNPGEKELFLQLRQGEILHSIAVARKLAELIKTAFQPPLEDRERFYIIKAGLLHDLGKIHYGMNVLEKSLAVLLAKLGFDRGKRIARSRMMEIYYRHPTTVGAGPGQGTFALIPICIDHFAPSSKEPKGVGAEFKGN